MILIGDSAAMVVWGHKSTTSVTMDEMIHHCKAVSRAVQRPFLIGTKIIIIIRHNKSHSLIIIV